MKLLIAGFVALLAFPSLAAAEGDLGPPGGPGYDEPLPQQEGQQRPQGHRGRGRMRAQIVARFDANGDGQLGPEERKQAKRAIRAMRIQRFIRRFDTNGDGNVGPGEVPAGAALKLRKLDRDGDGWVEPGERGNGQRGNGERRPGGRGR